MNPQVFTPFGGHSKEISGKRNVYEMAFSLTGKDSNRVSGLKSDQTLTFHTLNIDGLN